MKIRVLMLSMLLISISSNTYSQATAASNTASGTLPASPTQYLGFSNGADLIFKTTNVERLRMYSGGNARLTGNLGVGIVPVQLIHISKQYTGNPPFGTPLENYTTGIRLEHNWRMSALDPWQIHKWDICNDHNSLRIVYNTGLFSAMAILNNGNVGLGTNAANHRLHIHGGGIQLTGATPGYTGQVIFFGGASTGSFLPNNWAIEAHTTGLHFLRVAGATNPGNNFLYMHNANGYVGVNTSNPTARFTVNGNVLIGDPAVVTSLPANYRLYVDDGILTEKVKVAVPNSTDWSDYVFEKDYKLMEMDELEKFIQTNKHLPDVPSAEEVVENGIDLGKMDATLLKKIEELTLYMISLKKENEELGKKVTELETKLK